MDKNKANLWLWSVWGDKKETYTGYRRQIEKWNDEQLSQFIVSTPNMISFVRAFNLSPQYDFRKMTGDDHVWQRFKVWQERDNPRSDYDWELNRYPDDMYEHMWTISQQKKVVQHFKLYVRIQLNAAEDVFISRNTNATNLGSFVHQELRDLETYLSNM
jgi:hypothetical protein